MDDVTSFSKLSNQHQVDGFAKLASTELESNTSTTHSKSTRSWNFNDDNSASPPNGFSNSTLCGSSSRKASNFSDTSVISKKRTIEADNVDDILGQICAKMTSLSTSDSQNDRDDLIQAFMEVLECSTEEAAFFLESSLWVIEDAVILFLETGRTETVKKHHKVDNSAYGYNYNSFAPPSFNPDVFESKAPLALEYKRKQIFIHGLPDDWTAWVSRVNGNVFFVHSATGHMQSQVPPGFADVGDAYNNHNNGDNDSEVAVVADACIVDVDAVGEGGVGDLGLGLGLGCDGRDAHALGGAGDMMMAATATAAVAGHESTESEANAFVANWMATESERLDREDDPSSNSFSSQKDSVDMNE